MEDNYEDKLKNVKSGRGHLEKLLAIADENRKLSIVILALVFLIVFLGTALVKVKEDMVLSMHIPEKAYYSGNAQIRKDGANKVFYKLWGAYIVKDILGNYSHRDIKEKYSYLIDSLSPEKVSTYGGSIRDRIKNTRSQLVTHTYTEGKVATKGDPSKFTYISYGSGHKKIGEIEKFNETCEYQIDMSVFNFRMKVDRIYQKCKKIGE